MSVDSVQIALAYSEVTGALIMAEKASGERHPEWYEALSLLFRAASGIEDVSPLSETAA